MTKILWTALKVLILLIVLAALVVGAYYLCQYMEWPWWMAAVMVLGLLGLIALIVFIRKLIFRRREEGFIRQVIEQDESALKGGPVFERRQLQDLEDRWNAAITAIKRSHLKKLGNPLFALPWYLVMGEQGSGKTTVLRNSRLPTSFPELGHPEGDSATKNCDWWFFDDAIVLDTTGRYTVHADQARDKEEWKKFISLLSKYRRKEPINGLIVTVPAHKLFKERADLDLMEQYGQQVHLRIDQLMRVLGAKFPVYIMVTYADQILGMNSFCQALPWKAFRQSMGNINLSMTRDHIAFLDETIEKITERLKDLRLILLESKQSKDPNLFILPEEFPKIRPGLAAFLRGAFQENPYQEPALLRGIFFSSSRQEGALDSSFFKELKLKRNVSTQMPGTNRGLFLQDLFSRILPDDRYIYTPLKEFIKWRRSTRDIGLLAIAAVTIVVCGLMSMSFLKNYFAIEAFKQKFYEPPVLQGKGKTAEDIILMDYFRKEVIGLEKSNQNWWIPNKMGLRQSEYEELELKKRYLDMFKTGLLEPIDEEMQLRIVGFDKDTPDIVIGQYAEHLVKRINLVKAFLDGQNVETMAQMPQPSTSVVLLIDKTLLPTIADEFNGLYLYYLAWNQDRNALMIKKDELESRLIRLLELKGNNMEWLVAWVNREKDLTPITIAEFWEDKIEISEDIGVIVPPSYTVKGKDRIDDFIAQMDRAMDDPSIDPEILAVRKEVFSMWYSRQYIAAWRSFAEYFMKEELDHHKPGIIGYRSRAQWNQLAVKMTTFTNPYFDLLERMNEQLDHLQKEKNAPRWLTLTVDFQTMKSQAMSEDFVEEGLSLAKTVEKAAGDALADVTQPKKALESRLKAVKELQAFQKALNDISPALDSKEHAYQMAVQLYNESPDPAQAKSPFADGYLSLKRLRGLVGRAEEEEDLFWDLLGSPLDFLLYYTSQDAACSLQVTWEELVLSEVQGIPDALMQNELFDENGVVWKFVNGPADPFVGRNERGFYARNAYGERIPFLDPFYEFLKEGAIGRHSFKDVYEVNIEGMPTDINESAKEKPQAVLVEMTCSEGQQKIENYNYPVYKLIKWSPDKCGSVKLDIVFRSFTLTKIYQDYSGFAYFLMDFEKGVHIFTPEDFPIYSKELEKRDIKWIEVNFSLIGHEPVIDLIRRTPLVAPRSIVYCWH